MFTALQVTKDKDAAVRAQDFEKAGQLRDREMELKAKIQVRLYVKYLITIIMLWYIIIYYGIFLDLIHVRLEAGYYQGFSGNG